MQKKILSSVIGLVFLFAMLSTVSAFTCYQEQFDSEDDTYCNQTTGSYVGGFYGGDAENWHDGDYNTMTYNLIVDSGGNNAYTYVSWSMPDAPYDLGTELDKGITPILKINTYDNWNALSYENNITIPNECIANSSGTINLQYLLSSNDGDTFYIDCYDYTNSAYTQIAGISYGGSNPTGFIEEAMYWDIVEPVNYNITECRTITDSGTYQVVNDIIDASTGVPDGICLWISVDNVTIEGNGYSVDLRGVTDQSDVAIGIGNGGISSVSNVYINNLSVYQAPPTMGAVECIYSEYSLNATFNNVNLVDCPTLVFNGNAELQLLNTNMFINRTSSIYFYSNPYSVTGRDVALRNITLSMLGENNVRAFVPYMNLTDSNDIPASAFSLEANSFYLDSNSYPLLDVPMTVTFMNLPNANYYVLKNDIAISSWLYNPNTQELTFDTEGMGNYTYTTISAVVDSEGNLIQGSGNLYATMKSSGAGLGKFLGYLTSTLPILLLGIGFVGIIVLVGVGLVSGIKNLMNKLK